MVQLQSYIMACVCHVVAAFCCRFHFDVCAVTVAMLCLDKLFLIVFLFSLRSFLVYSVDFSVRFLVRLWR